MILERFLSLVAEARRLSVHEFRMDWRGSRDQSQEAVMSRLLLIAAEAFARIANSETAPHPASARPVATACGV